MMDTQVRGGNVLDEFDWILLGGMDWVCIGLFMGWAVIVGSFWARFQHARHKRAFIQRDVDVSGNGYGL